MAQLPAAPPHDRATTRHTLFTLLGVPWQTTRKTWLYLPLKLILCLILAFILFRDASLSVRLGYGLLFTVLLIVTQLLHIIGHTLSSHYVGAPMTAARILDFFILTHYAGDPPNLPRRIHLGRALGGPLMNMLVGMLALGALWLLPNPAVVFFTVVNLIFGAGALLPIPGIDGEVIWRELRRR